MGLGVSACSNLFINVSHPSRVRFWGIYICVSNLKKKKKKEEDDEQNSLPWPHTSMVLQYIPCPSLLYVLSTTVLSDTKSRQHLITRGMQRIVGERARASVSSSNISCVFCASHWTLQHVQCPTRHIYYLKFPLWNDLVASLPSSIMEPLGAQDSEIFHKFFNNICASWFYTYSFCFRAIIMANPPLAFH